MFCQEILINLVENIMCLLNGLILLLAHLPVDGDVLIYFILLKIAHWSRKLHSSLTNNWSISNSQTSPKKKIVVIYMLFSIMSSKTINNWVLELLQ